MSVKALLYLIYMHSFLIYVLFLFVLFYFFEFFEFFALIWFVSFIQKFKHALSSRNRGLKSWRNGGNLLDWLVEHFGVSHKSDDGCKKGSIIVFDGNVAAKQTDKHINNVAWKNCQRMHHARKKLCFAWRNF